MKYISCSRTQRDEISIIQSYLLLLVRKYLKINVMLYVMQRNIHQFWILRICYEITHNVGPT